MTEQKTPDITICQEMPAPSAYGLTISDDGAVIACVADEPDGKQCIMVNGRPATPVFDSIDAPFRISRDAKKIAYGAWMNRKWRAMVNDVRISPECEVGSMAPVLSDDGEAAAYRFQTGAAASIMIHDRQISGEGEEVEWPVFIPGTRNVLYVSKRGEKYRLMADGKPMSGEYDFVSDPVVSPDGKSFAFWTQIDELYHVVRNDKIVSRGYENGGRMAFSPDGAKIGYNVRQDERWCVVIDEKRISHHFANIERLVFSPDGESVAYTAKMGGQWYVMRNEHEVSRGYPNRSPGGDTGLESSCVHEIEFSPDGKKIAYRISDGRGNSFRERLMVNNTPVTPWYQGLEYARLRFRRHGEPVFAGFDEGRGVIIHGKCRQP